MKKNKSTSSRGDCAAMLVMTNGLSLREARSATKQSPRAGGVLQILLLALILGFAAPSEAGPFRPETARWKRWATFGVCAALFVVGHDVVITQRSSDDLFHPQRRWIILTSTNQHWIKPNETKHFVLTIDSPDDLSLDVLSASDELEISISRNSIQHPYYCEESTEENRPYTECKYRYFPTVPLKPESRFSLRISNPTDKSIHVTIPVPKGVHHPPKWSR